MPLGIQEDVIRLEVAMDDVLAVQTLQGEYNLGHVEAGLPPLQTAFSFEKSPKIPPWHIFHYCAEVSSEREGGDSFDNEFSIEFLEYFVLLFDEIILVFEGLRVRRYSDKLSYY